MSHRPCARGVEPLAPGGPRARRSVRRGRAAYRPARPRMRSREKLAPPRSTVLYVAEAPPAFRPTVREVHRVDELRGGEAEKARGKKMENERAESRNARNWPRMNDKKRKKKKKKKKEKERKRKEN